MPLCYNTGMDANKATNILAALLLSLNAKNGEAREGTLYAEVMTQQCTLDEFQSVLFLGEQTRLLKREPRFLVKITGRGTEMAQKIEKALVS